MNILKGEIISLKTNGSVSLVNILVGDIVFNTIIIENPESVSYLKKGNKIKVIFKETEVIIGKGILHTLSIQNKVLGNIVEIKKGELLSKLSINTTIGQLIAIITTDSINQLQLQIGEKITAMVKTTEIMISE